jgi:hypothetical protein
MGAAVGEGMVELLLPALRSITDADCIWSLPYLVAAVQRLPTRTYAAELAPTPASEAL